MGKTIDGGFVPEDDPMFNGSWMMFSVRKPSQSKAGNEPRPPAKSVFRKRRATKKPGKK